MSTLRYLRCTSLPDDPGTPFILGEVYAFHRSTRKNHQDLWGCPTGKQTTYYFGEVELKAHFEPATRAEFEASIVRVMQELEQVENEHAVIVKELHGASDLALHSGDIVQENAPSDDPADLADAHDAKEAATDLPGNDDTRLARPARKHPAAMLRNKAHGLSRKINSFAARVKEKREVIESKMQQQLAAFQSKVDEMNEQVAKLTEVVHMVNLYLGRDEAITCLRDGEPAPVGTPIAFRQNVLYMDEECALQESHGIDFKEIKKFDQWLLAKPAHLEQVIPNIKGVVVLQVRRNKKEYDYDKGDLGAALAAAQDNVENMKSYWLIRNGARLHRLWTDVAVGPRLVPREDELDHFFESRVYNHDTKSYENETIRPGSSKFYEAMKRANSHRRHYMRLLLVLQGILDRTRLFQPYVAGTRPNLLDDSTWHDQIVFIRDTEKVVEDGEPTFAEWQARINKHLRAGQRIVGHFSTYYNPKHYERPRVHPKHASGPSTDGVYTLVDTEDGFKFLYDRDETRWKRRYSWERSEEVPIKQRASYRLERDDRFFICVDNATVAEMTYYLNDRRHRSSYENMIPILRTGIKLKEKEAAEEAPFRELLLRKLQEAYPENPCTPERLEEIIAWWKFKVKAHRPLLADDAKAYTMIVAEYRRQSSLSPAEVERQVAVMQAEGLARMPDALAAWYKGDGQFLVFRAIEGSPVFVHEETWRVVGNVPVRAAQREWVLPRKADYLRWRVVHTTPAWAERPEDPRPTNYLPGNQHAAALAWVQANPPKSFGEDERELLAVYAHHETHSNSIRVVSVDFTPHAHDWTFKSKAERKEELERLKAPKLLDHAREPEFHEVTVRWKIKKGQYTFGYSYAGSGSYTSRHMHDEMQWGWKLKDSVPIWIDQAKFAAVEAAQARCAAQEDGRSEAQSWVFTALESAKTYLENQWETAEQAKFLKEGGEPEFFADHLKTLMKPKIEVDGLQEALEEAVNTLGVVAPLTGCTLAGALGQAKIKLKKPGAGLRTLVQSSWVLPPEKEPEPANEEAPGADDDADEDEDDEDDDE